MLPIIGYSGMLHVHAVRCRINWEVIKKVESSEQAVVAYFRPLHVSKNWPGRTAINLNQNNLLRDVISKW